MKKIKEISILILDILLAGIFIICLDLGFFVFTGLVLRMPSISINVLQDNVLFNILLDFVLLYAYLRLNIDAYDCKLQKNDYFLLTCFLIVVSVCSFLIGDKVGTDKSFINTAILCPLGEEVLMRGLLFYMLNKILHVISVNKNIYIISINAAFFAALHLFTPSFGFLFTLFYTFIYGVIFTYLRIKSGSIILPTIIHILVNSSVFLFTKI
jgi:uncharacterized protein